MNLSNLTSTGEFNELSLKNLIQFYLENFRHNTTVNEDEYFDQSVVYMDNLNLHQYVLLGKFHFRTYYLVFK